MNMLMNPQTKHIPLDLRVKALSAICLIRKIPYDEDFFKDMSHGIDAELQLAMDEGFGFLNKHPELMKHLKDFKL
jgi:hypothetical protein